MTFILFSRLIGKYFVLLVKKVRAIFLIHTNSKLEDDAWRKHLQDALSHNKKYFVSGKEVFGQTGYWRLRQLNEDDSAQKRPKR